MIGRNIANYHITERLGEGGMGTVYKATDRHLQRTVAIKMLHPNLKNHPDYFKRFRNEAHLSARISHPNVATLFDFKESESHHFIVMEYVDGKPLDEVLRMQGALPEQLAVQIAMQVLEGLGAAHDLGIMHRDLKPANIMITRSGFVKLMDFGIARLETAARMTRQNSVIGTLEYLAPELIKGGEPTKSADLYALGVMLYEMLSGNPLFQGDSEAALMYQIAHQAPNIQLPQASRKLVQVIKKLTHKQATRRYQDTREVLADLEKIHVPGRIDPRLLTDKLVPVSGEEKIALPLAALQENLRNAKLPKVPAKLPVEMDLRILGGALAVCLLILLVSLFGPGKEEPHPSEPFTQGTTLDAPDNEVEADPGYANARINNPSAPPRNLPAPPSGGIPLPPQGQAQETREDSPGTRTRKSDPQEQGDRKHVIKPLQSESTPKQETTQKEQAQESQTPVEKKESSQPVETREEKPSSREESSRPEETSTQRTFQVTFPDLEMAALLPQDLSSEKNTKGQRIYLQTTAPVYYDGHLLIRRGARVRAVISRVRSGTSGKKAFLGFELEAVETEAGTWLPVSYPEYSNTERGRVDFRRGLILTQVKIKSNTLTFNP